MSRAAPRNDKAGLLDQIRADILKHNICPDLAQEATNLVMGDGDPNADVVFIGEAPGKNEDLKGLPFVGAAGKFLDEMLKSIDLKRDDVYITNIVKYRPPNNRDPLPDEKQAFWPFLLQQISVIQPSVIATLGRHSMEYFLPGKRISEIHGQPKRIRLILPQHTGSGGNGLDAQQGADESRKESYKRYGDRAMESATKLGAKNTSGVTSKASKQAGVSIVILPLYHPAAALYDGSKRQTLIEDFASLPQIMKLINESK